MRQIRTFVLGLVGCAIALASVNYASAQSTTDGIVKVVAKGGDARYFVPGDSKPHEIKAGMILKPGTIIQTASGMQNYVDLVLNNAHASAPPEAGPSEIASYKPKVEQDGVRVNENTVLAIDKLTITQTGADTVTDTELDLKAGSILGTVKKLTPTSKYEVKIPNGVAGIRGTIYWLSASGLLKVLSGSVVVSYVGSDGNVITQVVNAGEQFDTGTGLVTPLTGQDILGLTTGSSHFRIIVTSVPTTFISPDHRIFFVSPGQGQNGQGQNGNGQGGNGQGGNQGGG